MSIQVGGNADFLDVVRHGKGETGNLKLNIKITNKIYT